MRSIRAWLLRLGGLFHKQRRDRDLAAELDTHLQMHVEDNLRAGMSASEARRQALIKLGGLEQTKEIYRDQRRLPLLETLFQDLRFAFRLLRKNPGFTSIAVLTLALGMGATTTIFSAVNSVILRPLPYQNQDRLLRVQETHPGAPGAGVIFSALGMTYATFLDLEREAKAIENVSAYRDWAFNITGGSEPEQVSGALVSGSFFAALGSRPLLGTTIQPEDDQAGGNNRVVVLSYALWQSRFGADPKILGQTLKINAEPFTVIGLMPPGFDFPQRSEMWCPLVAGGNLHDNRRAHLLTVLVDRKPGQSMAGVQGELTAFAESVEKRNPGVDDPSLTLNAVTLQKSLVAPVRPALVILLFAVGLLLLIACANVANLLLARTSARRKEIAVRLALGASPARLATLLLAESVFVSLLSGLVGLFFAEAGLTFIRAQRAEDLPRFTEINLDWHVFAFAFSVSILSGLLFGLAPALAGAKLNLNAPLKEDNWEPTGAGVRISNGTLTILQYGLATILLFGAGLLGSSLLRVLRENPGFNSDHLLTLQVFLSSVNYPEESAKPAIILHEMLERVRALPGVRSAGVVNALPITGGPSTEFVIEGRSAPRLGDEPSADIRVADPGYFPAMGIPLLAGRVFTEHDNAGSARVVLVNETLARTFWPNQNPIGRHITMKDWGPPLTGEIVGVVGDVKTNGLDAEVGPMIYWSYAQFGQIFNAMVVRTDGDPLRLTAAVKDRIWSVDRDQPVSRIQTTEQILSDSVARRRLYVVLLGVFASVALFLAAAGIYGVVSYSVTQRTREIGIRVALGAERADVLWIIIAKAARLALAGELLGIFLALGLTRLMASLLFGISAADPLTFAGVAILLNLVALAACYIPARRAMRVDPMVALRYE
ncbi:MAG TPA: ABC transporter permease [Candidatus Acidoferrum sp.]|nr:ABC transporter permease [Candidatus Acidoferrum sp.]